MSLNPETNGASSGFSTDICIVGGAGHVGLPLGLAFADKGQKVCLFDIHPSNLDVIRSGRMPFVEYGAGPILKRVIGKNLTVSSEIADVSKARYVIVAIGTPVDEYLNPKLRSLLELFASLKPYLNSKQTIVIRSTVYPRTCRQILNSLGESSGPWHVAYCPERIAQGYAIQELKDLPQLISGLSDRALEDARRLFSVIAPSVIPISVEEAELAKLFTNAWRYIQFATANQFYMMAYDFGVDFNLLRKSMVEGYGRAYSMPSAGFAAGPCLMKDTLQLAAFNNNNFSIGHAAMMVNEGLPGFIVDRLMRTQSLEGRKVGILGMAFKADIDDIRDSLSYKLGKILRFHGAQVLYSDEFADDPTFVSKEELVNSSEIVIIGAPHSAYKDIELPAQVELVDVWNCMAPRKLEVRA